MERHTYTPSLTRTHRRTREKERFCRGGYGKEGKGVVSAFLFLFFVYFVSHSLSFILISENFKREEQKGK